MLLSLLKKSETAKMAAKFTAGNFVAALIGSISAIIYGRWIGPEILGEFNKYAILTSYMAFGVIFVDAAFQRHFPYYLGKDDKNKALEIASIAHWWLLMIFISGSIVFIVLALRSAVLGDFRAFWGWLVQIFGFGVLTYGLYFGTLYRSNKDFLKLNRNLLFTSFIGLLALPLVHFFGFFGFAYRKIFSL